MNIEGGCAVEDTPHPRVDDVIRAREDDFFRELAAEEHKGTHPLQHMVASHQKLHSIGVPLHHLDPDTAIRKSRMGAKTSPYEQPQVLVEYMGRAAHDSTSMPTNLTSQNARVPKHRDHSREGDQPSSSATRHRQFLSKTLSAVHEQLESTTLVDISGQDVNLKRSKAGEERTGKAPPPLTKG